MKGSDKNVSYKEKETSTELYYFNVDIKFILKARLHQLDKAHEKNENNSKNQQIYKCSALCNNGKNKEYSEVAANSEQFKCPHCVHGYLEKFTEKNKLNADEMQKCTKAINKLKERFEEFNQYIIPANFFGPGKDYAYVGPGTAQ